LVAGALVGGELHGAVAVAQHDEGDAAAVAHGAGPPLHDDVIADVLTAQGAAGVGAFDEHGLSSVWAALVSSWRAARRERWTTPWTSTTTRVSATPGSATRRSA